jgi:hypothetical protein
MFIGEILCIKGEESILIHLSHMISNVNEIPDMVKAEGIVFAVVGNGRYYC